jgi:hypothetical protein
MYRLLFITIPLLLVYPASGQTQTSPDIKDIEIRLQSLFDTLYSDQSPDRENTLKKILEIMPEALSLDGAMEYSWSGLNRIGVVTSEDGRMRLLTWHLADDPDAYRYFGFIQVEQKRGHAKVFPLLSNGKKQRGVFKLDQSIDDWYGKLYYGIVTNAVKRKKYYTLLGMDFNDSRSNIKTVEVMTIQRNRPVFVKEMFFNGRDRVDRLVLEYSDQVVISVHYDPNLDMIAFDHLVPFHPIYEKNFEFYGPDGSFDGLEFSGGSWVYREDIDARLQF